MPDEDYEHFQPPDALIAATALVHGMTMVTRNARDFAVPELRVLNPWNDPDPSGDIRQ